MGKSENYSRLFSANAAETIFSDLGMPLSRYMVIKLAKMGELDGIEIDGRIFVRLSAIFDFIRKKDSGAEGLISAKTGRS